MTDPLETNGFYEFGPYRLDCSSRTLLRDGAVVPLTPKVADTLMALVGRAGQPVSKGELLRRVWPDTFVEESNLAQNISVLRKALGPSFIETLPKRGYRFSADVRRVSPQPAAALAPASSEAVPPQRPRRRFAPAAAFGLAALCVAAVTSWQYWQRTLSVPPLRSLAVLPFKNFSGDPAQDYIADGMTELVTAELSRTLRLRVVSRTSAMHYRNANERLASIARELRVDAVVEGSAAAEGSRLRVTVQLIQAATDRHLWANTYDRELSDLPLLQEEIARAVAREMQIPGASTSPRHAAPTTQSASESYLRARYYLDQRNGEDLAKAVSWYQKAIEEDPAYAPAYAGLADCYNQLGTVMIGGRSPGESRKLAMAAARRALEIDPDLAEAHAALAYSNLYDWNWEAARQGFERAIRLNPNYAPAHLWLAHYFAARAQFDPALQEVRLAADLDPLSPIIQTQVGWILEFARRYPEAIRQFREVLADNPSQQWALWRLGSALLSTRQYDAAIEVLRKFTEASNRSAASLGTLGHAYGLAGHRREAEALLVELQARARRQYVPPHVFVHIYVGLGERDEAFQWLERSYQERSNSLLWLGVDSRLDPLRADPRFDSLLRRVGLK